MLRNNRAIGLAIVVLAVSACGDDDGSMGTDAGNATDSGSSVGTDAGSGATDAGGTADATAADSGAGSDAAAMADAGTETDAGLPEMAMTTVTEATGGSADVGLEGDDEASVEVPAGAVMMNTDIEVAAADPMMLPALVGTGAAVTTEPVAFTPHGTAFATPITISFTIDGGVPAGAVILRLDDEADTDWELVTSTVDGDVISAEVSSFSIYTVATGSVCHQADPDSDDDGVCDSVDPCVGPNTDTDGNGVCDSAEARITGTVTDVGNGGVAIPGVTVTVYDDLQNTDGTTTTDASGRYFFGELTADTYTVVVADSTNCWFGSGEASVSLGEQVTVDIGAGCF